MATLSTEQSAYIQSQEAWLAQQKTSQFAKFLNKNPVFVTYYAINQAMSMTDAGTGDGYEEIGPRSPTRYNKVKNVPTFNFPTLQPEFIDDEGGYDTALDINDIAFIPGTIKPKPGDYMKLEINGAKPLLFRCNIMRYNTIASNDYYMADFDLIDISQAKAGGTSQSYTMLIEDQVVETYICKFENIGTNQKVLVTEDEDAQMSTLQDLVDELTGFYNDAFYDAGVDGFVLRDATAYENGSTTGLAFGSQWYYDIYLTRFINESRIFQNDSSDYTVYLPYLELLPLNFNYVYTRSVWNAVLKRTNDYMNQYTYAWNRLIQKRVSPFILSGIPCLHPTVEILDVHVYKEELPPPELSKVVPRPEEFCGWKAAPPNLRPYFSAALQGAITKGVKGTDLNPIEEIIYTYIKSGLDAVRYDRKAIINFAFKQDMFTYMHMPILIYILKQQLSAVTAS